VGVVPDVREDSLAQILPNWIMGAIYEPYSAHAVLIDRRPATEMTLLVRSSTEAASLSGALREAIRELNPEVPLTEVQTLRAVVDKSVSASRSIMLLFAIFAGLAIVLGAVGVYGVISYSVAQRTSEIGVRMALGASRGKIQSLILGHGARIALMGVGLGLIGAFLATRLMASLLYGVAPTDLTTFAAVAILLSFVAIVSCYFPARRATRVDPIVALRYQ
jgi:putative ABC transport system permease protein